MLLGFILGIAFTLAALYGGLYWLERTEGSGEHELGRW